MPDPRNRLLRLEEYLRGRLFGLEQEAVQGLFQIYAESSEAMALTIVRAFRFTGMEGRWRVQDPVARARNAELFRELDDEATNLLGASQARIERAMGQGYRAAYYGRAWVMSQVGADVTPRLIPTEAVAAAIAAPYEDSTFFERFGDMRLDFIRRLRRSMTASQIRGETIPRAIKRLADALGWDISGGRRGVKYVARHRVVTRPGKGLWAQTERIARTEILRTSNMGAHAVMLENADVLDGWEWITAMDERVCPICAPLDGKVFRLDSPQPMPPDGSHPLCRCTNAPAVKDPSTPPRETYLEWRARKAVPAGQDGGVIGRVRKVKAPKKELAA